LNFHYYYYSEAIERNILLSEVDVVGAEREFAPALPVSDTHMKNGENGRRRK